MKNLINTYLFICLSVLAYGQTDVKLEINHMQGANAFALNQSSTTTMGESYNANRLEYYMAEFALEHDGGIVTKIDSFWVLVNAAIPTSVNLGQYNITSLEAIHFSIGVEQAYNHLDPSQWITGHPLAPKSPSMHWGWSAGYRFLAIEGKCGSSLNYIYELHSLGDNYYYDQRIPTAGSDDNGDLLITLNADYDRFFDDLTLGTGMVDHREFPNNVKSLQNMRDRVFTSLEGNGNSLSPITGVSNISSAFNLNIYPNPSSDGLVNITSSTDLSEANIVVYDNLSRIVYSNRIQKWNGLFSFEIEQSGHYILTVEKDNESIIRKSIIISE